MLGSTILEIIIGLAFVYLLLSLLVSATNEILAAWLKLRSRNLWLAVQHLAGSDRDTVAKTKAVKKAEKAEAAANGTAAAKVKAAEKAEAVAAAATEEAAENWAKDLYERGLLSTLAPPKRGRFACHRFVRLFWPQPKGPSFIPPDTFAIAILERIRGTREHADASVATNKVIQALKSSPPVAGAQMQLKNLANSLTSTDTSIQTLKNIVTDVDNKVGTNQITVTEACQMLEASLNGFATDCIQEMINHLPDTRLKESLHALLNDAAGDLAKFQKNIEQWFNAAMDRATGWYKRKVVLIQMVLAIVFTVALNADSLVLARELSENRALRDSIVAQAEEFVATPPVPIRPPARADAQDTQDSDTDDDDDDDDGTETEEPTNADDLSISKSNTFGGESVELKLTLKTSATKKLEYKLSASETGIVRFRDGDQDEDAPVAESGRLTIDEGKSEGTVRIYVRQLPSTRTVTVTASRDAQRYDAKLTVEGSPEGEFEFLQSKIKDLNLPIGWISESDAGESHVESAELKYRRFPGLYPEELCSKSSWKAFFAQWLLIVRFHFLGWLVTAIAVSLGAPFWFDLINKVVRIRASGDMKTVDNES